MPFQLIQNKENKIQINKYQIEQQLTNIEFKDIAVQSFQEYSLKDHKNNDNEISVKTQTQKIITNQQKLPRVFTQYDILINGKILQIKDITTLHSDIMTLSNGTKLSDNQIKKFIYKPSLMSQIENKHQQNQKFASKKVCNNAKKIRKCKIQSIYRQNKKIIF